MATRGSGPMGWGRIWVRLASRSITGLSGEACALERLRGQVCRSPLKAGVSLVAKAAFEEPRDLFWVLALRPRSVCYAPGGMTRLRIRVLAGNRGDAASALIPECAESRRATPVRVSGDPRSACP